MSFTTTKMLVKVNLRLYFCNESKQQNTKSKGHLNLGAVQHGMSLSKRIFAKS